MKNIDDSIDSGVRMLGKSLLAVVVVVALVVMLPILNGLADRHLGFSMPSAVVDGLATGAAVALAARIFFKRKVGN